MKPDLQPLRALYRRSRALRFGVELGLALLVIAALGAWQTRGHARGALPPGALAALDGAPVPLASLRGKPVLLAVWAPWCTVCKAESQNLSWVRRLVGDRAAVVSVAAAYQDLGQVRDYVRERGVDYPVLLASPELLGGLGVSAFPSVYFLDGEGEVKRSVVGYTTTAGLLLRLLL